jgi:hypothetical protein|tara:strand:+ start:74 stop:865 length:792 start_codon:yes stop_codon:yes gene_type:complete
MIMKFNIQLAFVAAIFSISSCGTTDTTPPTICTGLTGTPSVLDDEIELVAGTTVTVNDAFCDNTELGEVRWDLHTAEGHEHEAGEGEGFALNSGTEWAALETQSLDGTNAGSSITLEVPLGARGIWDLVASVVDAEGNAAADIICEVHVDNDYIPAFILQTVDGVDPANWEGEPIWTQGSIVSVIGSVTDSNGIEAAELLLIRESDETVVWSAELMTAGETTFSFNENVVVPADAETGEYHFEMEASDLTGVTMHTGFHVEVE